jgi:thioredoxin reductase (NADPH)
VNRSEKNHASHSPFLFFFLGAQPCTQWLDDAVARAADGFILTGDAAGADNLLETSVPGIFAAGDVRSGSTKRCAAAVGEGSMAVQLVHEHLAASSVRVGSASTAPTSTRSRRASRD